MSWTFQGIESKKHELFQSAIDNHVNIILVQAKHLKKHVNLARTHFHTHRLDRVQEKGVGVVV
jgi:hypothetical protein